MGCCSSSGGGSKGVPVENEKNDGENGASVAGGSQPKPKKSFNSAMQEKQLLHTNSMLFPKDAMDEARKSVKAESAMDPIDELVELIDNSAYDVDPDAILTKAAVRYEAGNVVEYAPDMKESMTLTIRNGTKAWPISFGYKTLQGRSPIPPNKNNQDSLVVFRLENKPNCLIFGVFDGHGPFGDHASHFCRMNFHKILKRLYASKGETAMPQDLLDETLRKLHEDFIKVKPREAGIDPQVSGTTAIVAMLVDDNVYVGNVGDSRAVIGTKSEDGVIEVAAMSDDHKPERESERYRLEKTEAVLLTEGQLRGGLRPEGKTYICRKRNGEIVYGVLFTRSIGDLDAHQFLGVSADPEFKQTSIRDDDADIQQYLVLASDGIWDQMTNEEVMDVVFDVQDPLLASEKITEIAASRWDTDRNHSRRDDITICCVKLR